MWALILPRVEGGSGGCRSGRVGLTPTALSPVVSVVFGAFLGHAQPPGDADRDNILRTVGARGSALWRGVEPALGPCRGNLKIRSPASCTVWSGSLVRTVVTWAFSMLTP